MCRWWCNQRQQPLRVASEHDLGVRASSDNRFDLVAGIDDALCGFLKVQRGGVIHRVDIDRFAAQAGGQRLNECLPGVADAWRFEGAAGEYHFDVGALRIRLCACLCRRSRTGHDADHPDGKAAQYPARVLSVGVMVWYMAFPFGR